MKNGTFALSGSANCHEPSANIEPVSDHSLTTPEKPRRHVLYRHWSAEGELLYIGVTCEIPRRIKDHSKHSPWWEDIARIELEHFPDRKSVLAAEKAAIQTEGPRYNIVHRLREPKEIKDPSASASIGRENITARIVSLKPLYRTEDLKTVLGLASNRITNLAMERGELNWIEIPSPVTSKPIRYVSGWDLIDWLESLGVKT